ncbi:hypothetical protein [Paracoccus benzoatiresistens]|uniref:Uncharacterized protein n=1 Tax=Paracoccus benzoatiresistens TaxID=2997341 RepID=A0ABT4J9T5_9RHOB|nr:hypothetical protein [Paracoccus sp. EF6]MCZ0963669.1 hypothetical protein [Paracoccus sp. EF6]
MGMQIAAANPDRLHIHPDFASGERFWQVNADQFGPRAGYVFAQRKHVTLHWCNCLLTASMHHQLPL